jgi:hypothetical protein
MGESGIVGVTGVHYGHPDCRITKWHAEGRPSFGSMLVNCSCPPRDEPPVTEFLEESPFREFYREVPPFAAAPTVER